MDVEVWGIVRRIELFGPTVMIVGGDNEIRIVAPRLASLVALIAAGGGRRPAQELKVDLWPDPHQAGDSGALKVLVARLNRLASDTGGERLVVHEGGDYRFSDDVLVDIVQFRHDALNLLDRGSSLAEIRALLDWWPGSECPGEWADLPAVSDEFRLLGSLRLELLVRYVTMSLERSTRPEVLPLVLSALEAEPYDERLWCLLMRLYYRHGQQASALRAYDTARGRLVEDLGIEPGPELRAVHDAVLRHDPSLNHGDGPGAADQVESVDSDRDVPELESVLAAVSAALQSGAADEAAGLLDEACALLDGTDEGSSLRIELRRAEVGVLRGDRRLAETILDDIVRRAIELDDLALLVDAAIGPAALGSAGILGLSTQHERLQQAHDHVGTRHAPRVVELRSRLLRIARRYGDHERYDHLAPVLVATARESGSPVDLAHALYAAHKTRYPYCDPEGELAGLREAERLAANRDTELWVLAVQAQAVIQITAGRVDAGKDADERAGYVAAEARLPRRVWDSMTFRAGLAVCEGDLERARTESEQAFAYGTQFDISDAFGTYAMQHYVLEWHEDRLAGLGPEIDAMIEAGAVMPSLVVARGLVAVACGQPERARSCLDESYALLQTPLVDDHRLTLLCLTAQLALDSDSDSSMLQWLRSELEPFSGTIEANLSFVLGPIDRLLGALSARLGETVRAVELLERTAEAMSSVGWSLHEAWSLVELADASARLDSGRAVDAARRAHEMAGEHELARLVRLAEDALQELSEPGR